MNDIKNMNTDKCIKMICKRAARKEARTKWKEYISRHEVDKIKQIAYISAKEWEENICRMNDRKNE